MFNPDLSVTKLPVFKAVLILGGALTVGTTVAIGYHTNLSLCFTATCFNNLLEFFKVPIRLLAATLSIIGLIALAHRSEQSAKQIKLSESQNNFSNYYKHREEFIKNFEDKQKSQWPPKLIKIEGDAIEFHHVLYPGARRGDYKPAPLFSKEQLIKIKNFTDSLCKAMEKTDYNKDNPSLKDVGIERLEHSNENVFLFIRSNIKPHKHYLSSDGRLTGELGASIYNLIPIMKAYLLVINFDKSQHGEFFHDFYIMLSDSRKRREDSIAEENNSSSDEDRKKAFINSAVLSLKEVTSFLENNVHD